MNRLIAALAEVCRRHVRVEKRLLAPSRRIGQQWVRQVALAGVPAVNVRIYPLKALAFALGGPDLICSDRELLPPAGLDLLLDQLWHQWRAKNPNRYLTLLPTGRGLAVALSQSLRALRLAGVEPGDLNAEQFEVSEKGRDLGELLARYVHRMNRAAFADEAELFQLAVRKAIAEPASLGKDTLYLLPDDFTVNQKGWPQRLLDQLPPDRTLLLATDPSGESDSPEPISLRTDITRVDVPAASPPPLATGSVRLLRAPDEASEIKAALRMMLTDGVRLDQVELLVTDAATYVPLIHEIVSGLPNLEDGSPPLAVNFAEGLPVSLSRPGRALAGWVQWVQDEYPQAQLVALVRDGVLKLADESQFRPSLIATALASLPIGRTAERYHFLLNELLAGNAEEDADSSSHVRILRDIEPTLTSLLALLPDSTAPLAVLQAAAEFLEQFTFGTNELDNFSRDQLLSEIRGQRAWLERFPVAFDAWSWLASLLEETWVLQEGPKPATLHVALWSRGGHSGRPETYILGLDETRMRREVSPDPLLLDSERSRISPELPLAAQAIEEQKRAWHRLLARLRGRLTLSYPMQDLVREAELSPSSAYLEVFQRLTGCAAETLPQALTQIRTLGLIPEADMVPLSDAEEWQRLLASPKLPENAAELMKKFFPDRAAGLQAEARRQAEKFSAYHGWVPEAGAELNPFSATGRVFSANSLELLGTCPRKFFYHHVLRLRPPDAPEVDESRWLPADQEGRLLHELFHQYHAHLLATNQKPDFWRDAAMLQDWLEDSIAHQATAVPKPEPATEEAEWQRLVATLMLFLAEEELAAADSVPVFLEATLGLTHREARSEFDSEEPLRVEVGKGRFLRLMGRIDRIDRLHVQTESFVIWDYKSGGSHKHRTTVKDPFAKGRLLQPLIYLLMAEARLRQVVGPQVAVAAFGYFYPSAKGHGDRLEWSAETLQPGRGKLLDLAELASQGIFPPTDDPNDCTYCPFARICDTPQENAAIRQLLAQDDAGPLEPLRRLRHGE